MPSGLRQLSSSQNGHAPRIRPGRDKTRRGKSRERDVERETGIEPALSPWKGEALPLSYSRGSLRDYRSHSETQPT